MHSIKYILIIIFSFISFVLIAQQDTLASDELQVIKDFDAQLEDVDKIDLYPSLPSVDTQRQVLLYSVEPKLLDLEYDAPKIKPILQKSEDPVDTYNGFLRAGISYPLGGVLEAGYQYQPDKFLVGGKTLFQGLFNDWQLDNQRYWYSDTDLNAEYFFDQGFSLSTDIGYKYENRYFYGYDHELISFDRNDIKQYFSTFNAGLDFQNNSVTFSNFDYKLGADFYSITDNYTAFEKGILANAMFGKYFNKEHLLELKVNNNFINNTSDTITYKENLLAIIPSFTFHHKIIRVKAGLNLSLMEDGMNYFPNAEILANVYKNNVAVYLGWDGHGEQNSFREFSEINPFIISNPNLEQSKINYPHAGLKFDFKAFRIGFEAGYKMVKNQALFMNDWSNDSKRFSPIYADVDYIISKLNITAEPIKHFNIDLDLVYQNPKIDSLENNYHDNPDLRLESKIAYSGLLENKLTIGTRMFSGTKINVLNSLGAEESLKGFFDLGFFGKYQINNNFHLFLDLNNITHQKYQRWNGYENVGFNTTLGFFYKFK